MRALFLSLALVASLVVAGIALAPRLIDGRAIERRVAAEIERVTGRQVAIRGALDVHFLPLPGLSMARVVVGNPVAADEPLVIEIDRVDLDIRVLPLLRGEIDIDLGRLVRPVARLAAPPSPGRLADLLATLGQGDLLIQRLEIVDGQVRTGGGAGAAPLAINGINAEMDIDAVSGAVRLDGGARLQATPLKLHVDTTLPSSGQAVPLKVEIDAGPERGLGTLAFAGTLHLDPPAPAAIDGTVDIAAPDMSALLERLGALHQLPPAAATLPAGRAALRGHLAWSATSLKLEEASLGLAGAALTGSLAVDLTPSATDIALQITGDRVDLGAAAPDPSRPWAAWLEPPPGVRGTAKVALGALAWRGQELRQVRLDTTLPGDGAVRIDRLVASIPGNGSLDVQGAVSPTPTGPSWQGHVAAATDDLSGLLAWLGLPPGDLPAGRLQSFNGSADTVATGRLLSLADADVRLDASHITGAAKLVLGPRPTVAVKAAIDRLNLDGYVADPVGLARQAVREGLLGRVDAAVDLTVERLGWQDLRAGRVRVGAEIDGGAVKLDELVVDDLAGAHGRLVGTLAPGTSSFDLAGEVEVPAPLRLARLLGIELPPPLIALGALRGSGTARLDHGSGDVELSVDSPLLGLTATGTVGRSAEPDTLDLMVEARAPSSSAMLRSLGASGFAEPTLGGPLDGRIRIRRRPDAPYRLDLAIGLGATRVSGPLTIATDGPVPAIAGRLDLARIDPQALLDTYRFLEPILGLVPGPLRSWPGDWPRRPLDWRRLADARLDLALHATPVADSAELGPADLRLTIGDDRLTLAGIDLPVAGGRLKGSLAVDRATTAPRLAVDLGLDGADAAAVLGALRASPGLTGRLSLDLHGSSAGLSLGELVGNLDGTLSLRLTGAALDGVDLAASGPAFTGLDARTAIDDLSGDLRLVRGIARTEGQGLALTLPDGTGHAAGSFDLLAWMLSTRVTVTPSGQPDAPPVSHELLGPPDRLVLLGETAGAGPADAAGGPAAQP